MDYIYQARFEPDPDGGFLVTFPDVPEAITHGATIEEARASAAEALGLALRGIVQVGGSVPAARTYRGGGGSAIAVPADDALKLAVIEAFRAAGITKTELARRLGKAEGEARRILDPDYPSKLEMLSAALAVLGRTVVISIREAA
ncbi:MAG TPA: type II toxin-antitoxin system HicB family antitoxin [Kaistia sp.]|nr:type II toxin-antitoxin system HicB family antitoxin [Kaistia sp.]